MMCLMPDRCPVVLSDGMAKAVLIKVFIDYLRN